jgi:hypothetical protein
MRPRYMNRVGQNHIYTVYIRYFWLGNHQIYGVCVRIYTVLANPIYEAFTTKPTNPGSFQTETVQNTPFQTRPLI